MVFAASRFAQLRQRDVQVRDASTWAVVATVALESPLALGELADGSLLALDMGSASPRAAHLAVGASAATMVDGSLFFSLDKLGYVYAAKDPSEHFGGGADALLGRSKVSGGKIVALDAIELSDREHETLAGLGDGTVVYQKGHDFVRRDSAAGSTTHAFDKQILVNQIAAGPRPDTIWVTAAPSRLILVELAGSAAKSVVDLALARAQSKYELWDIAATGRRVAALLVKQGPSSIEWELAMFSETGKELWRKSVAGPDQSFFGASRSHDFSLALSSTHVVVGEMESLAVFSAVDGSSVPVPAN